ncbi:MAG: GDP-mannose 4,6-dehydratase [Deltaproteobacteria bacterium]|nr:GDP-mannose 4,6-dehydratase [Deltaproteobacteria bacterium]
MRYFVTGIGGFAGVHLAAALLAAGHEVTGLVRTRRPHPELEALAASYPAFRPGALAGGDVVDAEAVRAAIAGARPDGVFHLAGIAFVPRAAADPARALTVNVLGTRNVLAAAACEAPACRVVVVGSADAYGASANARAPITEECALRPVSTYGLSKAAADMAAFQAWWETGLAVVRARAFNHTGPGQSDAFVCSDFARQIARIERGHAPPVLRVGNLASARDFSDVRDVVRGYLALMERGIPGEAYNLCRGETVTVGGIVEQLRDDARVSFEVVEEATRVRRREIPRVVGDSTRAQALGWAPTIPLRQTLRELLAYWRVADASGERQG